MIVYLLFGVSLVVVAAFTIYDCTRPPTASPLEDRWWPMYCLWVVLLLVSAGFVL